MLEDLFDRSRFDSFFIDFLEFIEVLLQFEKAVPVGIIRGFHHRTLPGPSSLMMPEVVERDLEFIDSGIVLQQVFTFEFVEHRFCGFVIGLVVKPDGLITLLEKVVGVEFHMTGLTDQFHLFSALGTIPKQLALSPF